MLKNRSDKFYKIDLSMFFLMKLLNERGLFKAHESVNKH